MRSSSGDGVGVGVTEGDLEGVGVGVTKDSRDESVVIITSGDFSFGERTGTRRAITTAAITPNTAANAADQIKELTFFLRFTGRFFLVSYTRR